MNNHILIDSSFLYAVFNPKDTNHRAAAAYLGKATKMPLIPTVVLPEIGFLFVRDLGHHALERFVDEFADALLQMQDLQHSDLRRVQQIMNTYASAKFDLVDCCIMAMAERLQISQVCTFDRLISVFTARRIVNIWNFYLKPASIG